MEDLRQQYKSISIDFSKNQELGNQVNRASMYKIIGDDLKDKVVLDLACGDGIDAAYYASKGASVTGLDAAAELIELARQKYPEVQFEVGFAEDLSYNDAQFDCVFSKYAIMTSEDLKPIFVQVCRVLKKGGVFVYLVTHPMRQFMEKKRMDADYFKQEIVDSIILGATVVVREPTHTFADYFNADFFEQFEMLDYVETFDPGAEQINGAVYPGFFIVKARKK